MYHYKIYDLNLVSDLPFSQLISCENDHSDIEINKLNSIN